MTEELYILNFSILLALVQLIASAQASMNQRGKAWAAGSRDIPGKPLTGVGGRIDRAFRNLLETLPVFIGAVLIAHLAQCHGPLTIWGARLYLAARVAYVPAYLSDVRFLRTIIWFISLIGILMLLIAPLI